MHKAGRRGGDSIARKGGNARVSFELIIFFGTLFNQSLNSKKVDIMKGKLLIYFILFISVIFINLFVFYSHSEWLWVFYNSENLKKIGFDWIYTVWGAVLGVHGTTAALSLTFMGMVIDSINKNSPRELDNYLRKSIMKEMKFNAFGVDAIVTLIFSIYSFSIGGGLVYYALSQCLTIYFFVRYFNLYVNLFSLAKDKEYTFNHLHRDGVQLSECYTKKEDLSLQVKSKFEVFLKTTLHSLSYSNVSDFSFLSNKSNVIGVEVKGHVCDVNIRAIEKFYKYILSKEISTGSCEVILPDFEAMLRENKIIKFVYPNELMISKGDERKIKRGLSKFLTCENKRNFTDDYDRLVEGYVRFLLASIVNNNNEEIQRALGLLSSVLDGNVSIYPLKKFREVSYEYINPLALKLEAVNTVMRNIHVISRNERDGADSLGVLVSLAFTGLSRNDFNLFLEDNKVALNSFLSYSSNKIHYYEIIKELIVNSCNVIDYGVLGYWGRYFGNETEHLSVKHMSFDEVDSIEILKSVLYMQRVVVTFLLMRWSVISKDDLYESECEEIKKTILLWAKLRFFSNYNSEDLIYLNIFNIYEEKKRFILDEQAIRILPKAEAFTVTEDYYKLEALAIIFIITGASSGYVNLKYYPDIEKLTLRSNFTSFEYSSLLKAIDSSNLKSLLLKVDLNNDAILKSSSDLNDVFSEMKIIKDKKVQEHLHSLSLDESIVSKFNDELVMNVSKWLSNRFGLFIEDMPLTAKTKQYLFFPDKREFVSPIDGVHYMSSSSIYSEYIEKETLSSLFNTLKIGLAKDLTLDSSSGVVDKSKSILFVNKLHPSGRSYDYKYLREFKSYYFINDDMLAEGFYIIPLDVLICTKPLDRRESCFVEVKMIDESNFMKYTREAEFKHLALEKVALCVYPNFKITFKKGSVVYFG